MTQNIRIIDNNYTNDSAMDDCHEDHALAGFILVDDQRFHDLTIGFVPEYHQPYWLLAVHYDTGDSFHEETGKIAYIDLYSKEHIAYQNEGLINAHLTLLSSYEESFRFHGKRWPTNKPKPGYSIGLILDDHTCYDYYAAEFLGYFETVTSIEVIELMRKKEDDLF